MFAQFHDSSDKMKEHLISRLSAVDYVCITAGIWSYNNKGFIGVTVHWLQLVDNCNPTCFSAALASQRIKEWHTHDHIAKLLHDV